MGDHELLRWHLMYQHIMHVLRQLRPSARQLRPHHIPVNMMTSGAQLSGSRSLARPRANRSRELSYHVPVANGNSLLIISNNKYTSSLCFHFIIMFSLDVWRRICDGLFKNNLLWHFLDLNCKFQNLYSLILIDLVLRSVVMVICVV